MKISRWITYILVFVFSLGVVTLAGFKSLPDVESLRGCLKTKMYSYYLCKTSPEYVSLSEISPYVKNAIIVSEDGSFYEHDGFDWFEIRETIEKNISSLNYSRGGSTITQQLAKNVFLTSEKSLLRKIREAILTMQIEKKFSKDQILEKYLNVIEFAPKVYGVKSAARHYFGKSPGELDLLESAFLAFLLPNPKRYRESFVVKNLTPFARKRLAQIVSRMARFHKISQEERDGALDRLGGAQWLDQPIVEEELLAAPEDEPSEVPPQGPHDDSDEFSDDD